MLLFKSNGIYFEFVTKIIPELDQDGNIKKYFPQKRYAKRNEKELHKYGEGQFCKFKIPNDYKDKEGVYILTIDNEAMYVGECVDLSKRFNYGYGNISPRNCYKGGQQTNCRINKIIYLETSNNKSVYLFFKETDDRNNLERKLIKKINPNWNKSHGKILETKENKFDSKDEEVTEVKGKYKNLFNYLLNTKNKKITLTYDEIESIINSKLPDSAYNYRAWWANGGHVHSDAWLKSGWKVQNVNLGKDVTFKRI